MLAVKGEGGGVLSLYITIILHLVAGSGIKLDPISSSVTGAIYSKDSGNFFGKLFYLNSKTVEKIKGLTSN